MSIKSFNSRLNFLSVKQDWYKRSFRIKVQEPYLLSNGGQKLGALDVLPVSDRNIYKVGQLKVPYKYIEPMSED